MSFDVSREQNVARKVPGSPGPECLCEEVHNRFTIDTALWDRDGSFRVFEAAEGRGIWSAMYVAPARRWRTRDGDEGRAWGVTRDRKMRVRGRVSCE